MQIEAKPHHHDPLPGEVLQGRSQVFERLVVQKDIVFASSRCTW